MNRMIGCHQDVVQPPFDVSTNAIASLADYQLVFKTKNCNCWHLNALSLSIVVTWYHFRSGIFAKILAILKCEKINLALCSSELTALWVAIGGYPGLPPPFPSAYQHQIMVHQETGAKAAIGLMLVSALLQG